MVANQNQSVVPALLRLPAVCHTVGLSKSQIYRLIRAGAFPPPVRIGANSVAWPADAVGKWVAKKVGQLSC